MMHYVRGRRELMHYVHHSKQTEHVVVEDDTAVDHSARRQHTGVQTITQTPVPIVSIVDAFDAVSSQSGSPL